MRTFLLALSASIAFVLPAPAQEAQTISPGMTVDEVRSTFGAPARVREQGAWSYLFYANNCQPGCGSADVVFLREGQVVAAVLRSPARHFAGSAAAVALRTVADSSARPAGSIRIDTTNGSVVRGIRIETQPARDSREPPTNLGVMRGQAPVPVPADTTAGTEASPADTIRVNPSPPDSMDARPQTPDGSR